jgi:hypothetical protein
MDAVHPLNYAPKQPRDHRDLRRVYRIVWIGGLIAALFFWGPGLWRWANFLYWEHRSLTYQLPANQVAWEADAGKVIQSSTVTIGHLGQIDALIFLHELRGPDGRHCLVSLSIDHFSMISPLGQTFQPLLPDRWLTPLIVPSSPSDAINSPFRFGSNHWKFFTGQPDPSDQSHFTFDYELDGQRHTCDGWLNNSGFLIVSPRP